MKNKIIAMSLIAMLAASGTVNAAELDVLVKATKAGRDTVELVTEYDDLDLKWVSACVEDANNKIIWLGEKRPNVTENLQFNFEPDDERTRTYKATVSFIGKDDTVTQCVKEFIYYSYDEIQAAIRQVLNKEKTFHEVKDILALTFNELYENVNNDSLIVDEMNVMLQGNEEIEHSEFLDTFEKAIVKAALNSKDENTVKYIIDNYSETVGLTDDLKEKSWYDDLSSKANVISKLAQNGYDGFDEFKEAFRGYVFLEKVNAQHNTTILAFLREHADNGYKYLDGKAFTLDFAGFDAQLTTTAKKDYAAMLIAQSSYDKSSLEALYKSFNDAVSNASTYNPPTSSGGGATGGGSSGGGSSSSNSSYSIIENKPVTPGTATGFTDISKAEWARDDIEYCIKNGIVNGKSDTEFCPNDLITREEFTAIIARAFKLTSDNDVEFNDVSRDMWCYDSIKAAYHNGIISGMGNEFGIGKNITRQDMAVMMYRMAKRNGLELEAKRDGSFNDIDNCADYAKEAIDTMYKAMYINGVSDGMYQPAENATRAQAVVLLCNLLGR